MNSEQLCCLVNPRYVCYQCDEVWCKDHNHLMHYTEPCLSKNDVEYARHFIVASWELGATRAVENK